jgi:hypothetical protein
MDRREALSVLDARRVEVERLFAAWKTAHEHGFEPHAINKAFAAGLCAEAVQLPRAIKALKDDADTGDKQRTT